MKLLTTNNISLEDIFYQSLSTLSIYMTLINLADWLITNNCKGPTLIFESHTFNKSKCMHS